jgi:DNA-binding transcriptional regulator YiaG
VDPLNPPPSGYTTGTARYTPEFSARVRRRVQQHRLSRQELPAEESLKAVRRLRHQSQLAVASQLGTTQSEISKLEQREDALISTIAAYVTALGGTLDLVARFPGLHVRLKLGRG